MIHAIKFVIQVFSLFLSTYLILVSMRWAAAQKLGYLKKHMVTHLLNDPPKNTLEQVKLYMCDASDLKSGYLIHQ